MSILENLALADCKQKRMNLRPAIDKRQRERYRALLAPLGLGLENMLQARAGTLSGGQRQALALVMATLSPISCLILDEHTAALDPQDLGHHHGPHRPAGSGKGPSLPSWSPTTCATRWTMATGSS